ncbi:basic salivary proline-rich protein 1-like [Sylvia atricapilla]|uniref:basic salivary proline-rich protein 1-like n=1 Tax=Sylvia atricapilla TaxID=48155 RepID=UPI003396F179
MGTEALVSARDMGRRLLAGGAAPEAPNLWLRPPTPRRPGHPGARDCTARDGGDPGAGPSPRSPTGSARRSPAERRQSLRRGEGRRSWAPPPCPPRRPRAPARAGSYLGRRPRRLPRAGRSASRGILRGTRRRGPGAERSAAPAAGHGAERSPGAPARSGAEPRQPGTERISASAAGQGADRSPGSRARSGAEPLRPGTERIAAPAAARSPERRRRRAEPAAGTGRAGREAGRGRRERGGGCMCGESRLPPPRSLPASPPSPPAQPSPAQPCPARPSPASAGDSENAAPGPRPGLAPGPPPGTRPGDPARSGQRLRSPSGWRGPRRGAEALPAARLRCPPRGAPAPGARIVSAAPAPCRPRRGRERGADRGRGRPGRPQVTGNPPVPGAEN